MWHDGIYGLTPVENVGGIWFKREDKFSDFDRVASPSCWE